MLEVVIKRRRRKITSKNNIVFPPAAEKPNINKIECKTCNIAKFLFFGNELC
jgi:hypothetical protein